MSRARKRWSGSVEPADGGAEYSREAEAERIALEGRPKYGRAEEHFRVVSDLWNSFLRGRATRSEDVPVMMQLLKIGRIATGVPLADNQIDITGYGNLYNRLMKLDAHAKLAKKKS